jgi:WD repeat and SOF domain-containing protein 1
LYSMDSRYIVTGSEDTNIRIWKARASESLHTLLPREKEKLLYSEKLKKKYKYNQEIKRILRHRHLPKFIMKRKQTKHFQKEARHKKLENMRANNRPEDAPFTAERKKDLDTREDDY